MTAKMGRPRRRGDREDGATAKMRRPRRWGDREDGAAAKRDRDAGRPRSVTVWCARIESCRVSSECIESAQLPCAFCARYVQREWKYSYRV